MIKNLPISVLALTFAVVFSASAQVPAGGFQGPSVNNNATVADALKMSDDTPVVLVGAITKSLGGEKYLFKDSTGTIVVEIDDEDWRGQVVKPENTVELRGEVDKDLMRDAEIDVDVVIVKQ